MRIRILGCGGSNGVPAIGGPDGRGHWGACDPANPRNRRSRSSIVVDQDGQYLLVDTSPDLRTQLMEAGIGQISAVLYTHDHADHTHGVNDLRRLARRNDRKMAIYGSAETLRELRRRFGYAFASPERSPYPPMLDPHEFGEQETFGPIRVTPFEQDHGFGATTLGFRFDAGNAAFAYSTDVTELDARAFEVLDGVDLWVVDCTCYQPHPTHAHLDKTLGWIERLGPSRAVLTHMDQSLDYEELAGRCPENVEPAYDGMVIEL